MLNFRNLHLLKIIPKFQSLLRWWDEEKPVFASEGFEEMVQEFQDHIIGFALRGLQ